MKDKKESKEIKEIIIRYTDGTKQIITSGALSMLCVYEDNKPCSDLSSEIQIRAR